MGADKGRRPPPKSKQVAERHIRPLFRCIDTKELQEQPLGASLEHLRRGRWPDEGFKHRHHTTNKAADRMQPFISNLVARQGDTINIGGREYTMSCPRLQDATIAAS